MRRGAIAKNFSLQASYSGRVSEPQTHAAVRPGEAAYMIKSHEMGNIGVWKMTKNESHQRA